MLTGELSTPVRMSGEIYRGVGSTDYNELENKPSINGVELVGNLSLWQPKNFSTEEQNTGLKWINGKDIYKITIEFPSRIVISSTGWSGIFPHNNIYELVFNCMLMNNDGISYIVDCACNDSTNFEIYVYHQTAFDNITFYYTKK